MDPRKELKQIIETRACVPSIFGRVRTIRIIDSGAGFLLTAAGDKYTLTLIENRYKQTDIDLDAVLVYEKKERIERFFAEHFDKRWYCTSSVVPSDIITKIISLLNDPHLFDESGTMTKAAR